MASMTEDYLQEGNPPVRQFTLRRPQPRFFCIVRGPATAEQRGIAAPSPCAIPGPSRRRAGHSSTILSFSRNLNWDPIGVLKLPQKRVPIEVDISLDMAQDLVNNVTGLDSKPNCKVGQVAINWFVNAFFRNQDMVVEKAAIQALPFIHAQKNRGESFLWYSFGIVLVALGITNIPRDAISNLLFGLKLFRSWQLGKESLDKFNRACEEKGCMLGGLCPYPLHDPSLCYGLASQQNWLGELQLIWTLILLTLKDIPHFMRQNNSEGDVLVYRRIRDD
ncbi:hypothetical protein POM88_013854 [Heracleum sosnowskyi]|uniref:Uncharacterized protein n=1 Tax=Heracleum sosnowskyi TaxID=360622 RepID=A0AAD8J1F0_9APIA|nr:hypothetical protein POM88_013854 [Heracleum sosnowskyi]